MQCYGENGIVKKAEQAKGLYENSVISEEEEMNTLLAEYENMMASVDGTDNEKRAETALTTISISAEYNGVGVEGFTYYIYEVGFLFEDGSYELNENFASYDGGVTALGGVGYLNSPCLENASVLADFVKAQGISYNAYSTTNAEGVASFESIKAGTNGGVIYLVINAVAGEGFECQSPVAFYLYYPEEDVFDLTPYMNVPVLEPTEPELTEPTEPSLPTP